MNTCNKAAGHRPPSVAVVVLGYNQARYTIACLNSLLNLSPSASWIIAVDNNSTEENFEDVQRWMRGRDGIAFFELDAGTPAETVTRADPLVISSSCSEHSGKGMWLVRSPVNKGYAGGNNLGIALACKLGADAVWLLNNDTEVSPGALGAMRDELFSRDRPGLCGSLILYHDDPRFIQCRGGGRTNKWTGLSSRDGYRLPLELALKTPPETVASRLHFIYGASVMASREFIETVGMMDERYFMYCEEQDWAYSAAGRFEFAYAPQAIVYHHEGVSTGWPSSVNPKRLLQMTRSRIRLTAKHFPYALPTVCCAIVYAACRLLLRRILLAVFGIGRRRFPRNAK